MADTRGWEWPALRTKIPTRDNFQCALCTKNCGHVHHQYIRGIVKCDKLDVDHRDGNKANNDERNLRSVCREANRGSGRCK